MSSLTENHKAGMQVKVHEAGIWYYGRLGSNRQVTSKGSTTERGVFFLDKNGEETMAFVDVRLIIDDTENKAMSLAPPSKQQEV